MNMRRSQSDRSLDHYFDRLRGSNGPDEGEVRELLRSATSMAERIGTSGPVSGLGGWFAGSLSKPVMMMISLLLTGGIILGGIALSSRSSDEELSEGKNGSVAQSISPESDDGEMLQKRAGDQESISSPLQYERRKEKNMAVVREGQKLSQKTLRHMGGTAPGSALQLMDHGTIPFNPEAIIELPATPPSLHLGDFIIYNLSSINSPNLDYAPTISPDGKNIYFVSNREGGVGGHDIWRAEWVGPEPFDFAEPVNLGSPINSDLNEGNVTISSDGKELYFALCNRADGRGDCDLYVSRWQAHGWSAPTNLGNPNSNFWDSQPSVSPSGDTLYFVSNRLSSQISESADIFMAIRGKDGTWGEGINIGEPVNTPDREDSPFISRNGSRLYFASMGHWGFGGLDYLVSEKNPDGTWGEPQNLGTPFNTSDDDRMLTLTDNGNIFVFTSQREEPDNLGSLDLFMAVRKQSTQVNAPKSDHQELDLLITPNPASTTVRFDVVGRTTSFNPDDPIEIYSMKGELMFSLWGENIGQPADIIDHLRSGEYLVKYGTIRKILVVKR